MTLDGTTGRQVHGVLGLDAAAVRGDEFVTVAATWTAAPSSRIRRYSGMAGLL